MGRSTPLVSVIVPTYQRAELLPRALASVAEQTYRNLEVIVVDDGSTDATAQVVAAWAGRFARPLRYLRQAHAGCAAARNHGLGVARGRHFAFLDSDDCWTPEAIESLVAAVEDSGADFAYSPAIEVDESGREHPNPPVAAGRPERFAEEHFFRTNLRNGAALFRRKLLLRVGGVDESLRHNEDSDFVQRVAIAGRASYCAVPSVRVYRHAGRKSRDRVAIQRALLASARRTLARHPGFARRLGARAPAHLRALEARLLELLIQAERWQEARQLAAASPSAVGRAARWALRLRRRWPLRLGARRSLLVPG